MRLPVWLIASAVLVLAVFIVGAGLVSAQTHPNQVGPGGGLVQGWVYGFNMYDELEPIVWATVQARTGNYVFTAYTGESGSYSMFLPTGKYNFTVDAGPAYKSYSQTVTLSNGAGLSGINFYLEQSHVPIPEFPTQILSAIMVAAFAAALIAQRKMHRKRGLPQ